MNISSLSYSELILRYPVLSICENQIIYATSLIIESIKNGGKVITAGNGGSSADAEHICGELTKSFMKKRRLTIEQVKMLSSVDPLLCDFIHGSVPALSLGVFHSSISAFANDVGADHAFAQLLWGIGNKEDVFLAISTSGNSRNIVEALKIAKAKGISSIALTGELESASSKLATVSIQVPHRKTHLVQELHLPVYHAMCMEIENFFWKD